jgi:hypothetical protein
MTLPISNPFYTIIRTLLNHLLVWGFFLPFLPAGCGNNPTKQPKKIDHAYYSYFS